MTNASLRKAFDAAQMENGHIRVKCESYEQRWKTAVAAKASLADVLEEAFREAEDIATATGIVPKADLAWRERARAALRDAGRLP